MNEKNCYRNRAEVTTVASGLGGRGFDTLQLKKFFLKHSCLIYSKIEKNC